jgi:C4-dicarboxylate-specific signal transduction histidine kinase
MRSPLTRLAPWLLAWALASLLVAGWLVRSELTQLREAFETDARITHRLLSQRVVQHDAMLATLALLGNADATSHPEQRLPTLYPHILSVQRQVATLPWADAGLQAAQAESQRLQRAVLAGVDLPQGRYQMLLAAAPLNYLLQIDLRRMVPWSDWPMDPATSPVRVSLTHAGQTFLLQTGRLDTPASGGWHFEFRKQLAAESQPLLVLAERQVGWGELSWRWLLGQSLLLAGLLGAARTLLRQRQARRRAEELLRLGQIARLNTLGELAAGMAHELNQPLTAVLANTQAASRLLNEDEPDLPCVRQAMTQAVAQARRASEVITRLRRAVERPDLGGPLQAVKLQDAARQALYLLEPELARHQVSATLAPAGSALRVRAEPVALEQIIHNLLMNALQALDKVPASQRRLSITLSQSETQGHLSVQDSGPGIAASVLPRLFEPFFTTREGGLGLGLSLCETLASGMGGSLSAHNRSQNGAEFILSLPLADATESPP